ncbi:MAG: amino acid racemase [Clostridiales bacterium]|nr:amino acid racemase [Clostridiales bacterium]
MKLALGILGGMGPQATLDFQQKILDLTFANCDQEHMRVFVDNHPQIPDRIEAVLGNNLSLVPAMQESLDKLIAMGAACIAMPCVGAHCFLGQLNVPEHIVFANLAQIIAIACAQCFKGLKVGILASAATAHSKLLNPYFERYTVGYLYPAKRDQHTLNRLIYSVKAKGDLMLLAGELRVVARNMVADGANCFILACTELPIIAQAMPLPYPYLDATQELAKEVISLCGYSVTGG